MSRPTPPVELGGQLVAGKAMVELADVVSWVRQLAANIDAAGLVDGRHLAADLAATMDRLDRQRAVVEAAPAVHIATAPVGRRHLQLVRT